jgi:hypothetical protein
MAATKTPIATDSAAELNPLVGDDVTATFEDDPKFIDSNPTDGASSENVEVQRDTDDSEDSDEEEDELEDDEDDELIEEDDDEDVEDEDDDLDDDEDEEDDDEDEVGAAAQYAASLTSVHGASPEEKNANAMEEDDDVGDEEDTLDAQEEGSDTLEKDRAIDAALRMSALVAVTAELAANL